MTTLIRYAPDDRVIDLAAISPADLDLITSLHGSIARGEHTLICLQPGGGSGEMYVKRLGGKWFAAHFPGGAHGPHEIIPESDEHKRQKDYWALAAEIAGWQAEQEVHIPGGRLDVAITGCPVPTDIEVQRSYAKPALIKARTTRYSRAGFLPAWFNDAGAVPRWLAGVPALGCNAAPWNEFLPAPRSVTATGLTVVTAVRCEIGAFNRCPDGNYRPCGRYHPKREPWRGLTVDDVAAMIPAGEILPLHARDGNVYLASHASFMRYGELTGGLGHWIPGGKPKPERPPARDPEPCRNPVHDILARDEPAQPRWPSNGLRPQQKAFELLPMPPVIEPAPRGVPIIHYQGGWRDATQLTRHLRSKAGKPVCASTNCRAIPQGGAEYCQSCRLIRRLELTERASGA